MRNPLWPEAGPAETCRTCAWSYRGGRGTAVDRCRRHDDRRVRLGWPACPGWDAELDCRTCGACCREAYDAVEVSARDPFRRTHPELLVERFGRKVLPRVGPWCVCLEEREGEGFTCSVYGDRPRSCREFTLGSQACSWARRRIGLSR